jgi:hypothetical protein
MLAEQTEQLHSIRGDQPIAIGTSAMLTAAGEASALLDIRDMAAALYPALAALAERFVMQPFSWVLTQRIAGMAAAACGQWADAQRHLDRALEQARSLPNRLDEPAVHYWQARLLLDRGHREDRGRAAEDLDRAMTGFAYSGATLRVEMARRLRESL